MLNYKVTTYILKTFTCAVHKARVQAIRGYGYGSEVAIGIISPPPYVRRNRIFIISGIFLMNNLKF